MRWDQRLAQIRGDLNTLLEEAENDDQKAATRSIMTCVDAWKYVDDLGIIRKKSPVLNAPKVPDKSRRHT